jgi:hypothetical protein
MTWVRGLLVACLLVPIVTRAPTVDEASTLS